MNQTEGLQQMLDLHLGSLDDHHVKGIYATISRNGSNRAKSDSYPVIWDSGEPDKKYVLTYSTDMEIPTLSLHRRWCQQLQSGRNGIHTSLYQE